MAQHITIILPPPFHKGGRSCIAATPWDIPNPLTSLEVPEKAWTSFIHKVFTAWARCTWGTICDILVCATIVGIPFLYCKDDRALECARRSIEEHCRSDLNLDVRCSHTHVTEVAGVMKKLQVVFTPIYQYRGSIKYCFASVTASSYLSHHVHRAARNASLTQNEAAVKKSTGQSKRSEPSAKLVAGSAVPMSRQLQSWRRDSDDSELQPDPQTRTLHADHKPCACTSHNCKIITENTENRDTSSSDHSSKQPPPVACGIAERTTLAPRHQAENGDGLHRANEKVTPCKLVLKS